MSASLSSIFPIIIFDKCKHNTLLHLMKWDFWRSILVFWRKEIERWYDIHLLSVNLNRFSVFFVGLFILSERVLYIWQELQIWSCETCSQKKCKRLCLICLVHLIIELLNYSWTSFLIFKFFIAKTAKM